MNPDQLGTDKSNPKSFTELNPILPNMSGFLTLKSLFFLKRKTKTTLGVNAPPFSPTLNAKRSLHAGTSQGFREMEGMEIEKPLTEEDESAPWYRGVSRYAWIVLAVAALGWMFDTMDQNLFNQVRARSLTEILAPSFVNARPGELDAAVKEWAGTITTVFLIGWAVGGMIFGVLGDRLGRTRTMVFTILIYALFTGLNGLAQTPYQYALCRFLTALGVGGEFAAGTALVAEVWSPRSRPMALGLLQGCSTVGNIMAALITISLSSLGWRWTYAVGILPALLVIWIRQAVKEPEKWQEAKEKAAETGTGNELGNLGELFRDPTLRRNTVGGILLALAGIGGLWGVGFFLPDLITSVLKPMISHLPDIETLSGDAKKKAIAATLQVWSSKISISQQVGAFCGMFSYAALSQRTGRKPALFLFFILAFCAVEAAFHFLRDIPTAFVLAFLLGYCGLAPFAAYAIYFPELYPTRLRSTGIGFCYNGARLLAAFAPFLLGSLAKKYAVVGDDTAGLRTAASIVAFVYLFGFIGLAIAPETKGKPLPE